MTGTTRVRWTLCVIAAMVGTAGTLGAYALIGSSWPGSAIVMHMQLGSSGTLADGSTWNTSAESALATWNPYLSRSSFRVVRDSTAPIADGNGYNNVVWADDVYGTAFGARTLAVTSSWARGATTTDADVLFNRTFSWNSYRGTQTAASVDIRRVALHEFGHVLGLGHPDQRGQAVSAIMNSVVGDLDRLTADDIAGAQALYGAAAPAPGISAPGPPRSLTVSSTGATVFLSWLAPATGGSPTTYVIEAGSGASLANLANFSTGGVATSYSAGGIGAGLYYVRIRARNAAGTGAASNEAALVVGSGACTTRPAAPGSLVGGAAGSTVTLGWNPAGGNPTSYIVEAGSSPGLSNLANSDTGSTAAVLTARGVGRGVYYVRVRGKNACGLGPPSNEIIVIVP